MPQSSGPVSPASILPHAKDYRECTWVEWEKWELAMWVHLFSKRAHQRSNREKQIKDLKDAQNYLDMLQAKLNADKLKLDLAFLAS